MQHNGLVLQSDDVSLVLRSSAGDLLSMSVRVAYLMSRMNDGILVECIFYDFDSVDEDTHPVIQRRVRITIEEVL